MSVTDLVSNNRAVINDCQPGPGDNNSGCFGTVEVLSAHDKRMTVGVAFVLVSRKQEQGVSLYLSSLMIETMAKRDCHI